MLQSRPCTRMTAIRTGSGPKMPQWVKPYFKYVLPVLIAVILVQGLL